MYNTRQQLAYVVKGDRIYQTDAYNTRQQLAYVIKGAKTQNPKS
jgi:hypothetical protein